jgi:DNA mismatch endonuclease (patch repair protein)
VDTIDPNRRSENMRRIRSRDTEPELVIRRVLTRLGFRYRLHWAKLPGKPDLAITTLKKAIFVHGCFWHQHNGCRHGRLPKSRLDYWKPKLARNQARDREVRGELETLGWKILVIWECEISDEAGLERRLMSFIETPTQSGEKRPRSSPKIVKGRG